MDRRQFLLSSTLTMSGCSNVIRKNPNHSIGSIPIVDTHQHLWNLRQFQLPWLKPGGELTRDFTITDYTRATVGLNIKKTIYMEVAVVSEQKQAEAEYIIKICEDVNNLTHAAVIGGMVLDNRFQDYIMRFKGNPFIKGVRHGLNNPTQLENDCLIHNLKLLGSLNMSFDLLIPPGLIGKAAKLAERCGGTKFILDHCGNADPLAFNPQLDWDRKPQHNTDQWKRDVETFAKLPNTICKISGIIARVPKGRATVEVLSPIVTHCLETFGPDRVVYGSDWPVCTRGESLFVWTKLLHDIVRTRPYDEIDKLFWKNATRCYGLA